MKIGKLVAHIPARAGSKRVRSKNLRMLNGRPMIEYAINCAKACDQIDEVYVNTDCPTIMALAESLGVGIFERDASLATDTASGDDFTYDIIEKLDLDTLMMISPVCPLVTPVDVISSIDAYQASAEADTLITCSETSMQVALMQNFVNIDPVGPLKPSQENPRIQICNWAVTIWNGEVFRKNYRDFRGGYCGTHRILHPIDPMHSLKVSYEEDFRLVEALMIAQQAGNVSGGPEYWTA
jgi:CMP-N-acetylneuraminic acid synthetase